MYYITLSKYCAWKHSSASITYYSTKILESLSGAVNEHANSLHLAKENECYMSSTVLVFVLNNIAQSVWDCCHVYTHVHVGHKDKE